VQTASNKTAKLFLANPQYFSQPGPGIFSETPPESSRDILQVPSATVAQRSPIPTSSLLSSQQHAQIGHAAMAYADFFRKKSRAGSCSSAADSDVIMLDPGPEGAANPRQEMVPKKTPPHSSTTQAAKIKKEGQQYRQKVEDASPVPKGTLTNPPTKEPEVLLLPEETIANSGQATKNGLGKDADVSWAPAITGKASNIGTDFAFPRGP
jgi:hypothetical protein